MFNASHCYHLCCLFTVSLLTRLLSYVPFWPPWPSLCVSYIPSFLLSESLHLRFLCLGCHSIIIYMPFLWLLPLVEGEPPHRPSLSTFAIHPLTTLLCFIFPISLLTTKVLLINLSVLFLPNDDVNFMRAKTLLNVFNIY